MQNLILGKFLYMRYRTFIRKRKSRGREEWLAHLMWEDVATQESGQMCRSAESRSEAQRKDKSLENQFLADESEGDLSKAARRLEIKRTTLYMRIKRMQTQLSL